MLSHFCVLAQEQQLVVKGKNAQEQRVLDSIHNPTSIPSKLQLPEISSALLEKIQKLGYLEANYSVTTEDRCNELAFELGNRTQFAVLNCKNCSAIFENYSTPIRRDTIRIPYTELENLMDYGVKKLEARGESLAKLQLTNLSKHSNYISATLVYFPASKRNLNKLIIKGYDQFPKGHSKNITTRFQKTPFNQKMVSQIKKELDTYPFCTQLKYPEIEFTKDSTSLYVYVQKKNANSLDGLIGFSTDESKKTVLSGYVDVLFQNLLYSGESIAITWKSDGKKQSSFMGNVELPYVFTSPLALKMQLQVFKQDSTFQNTKTALQLGYYFKFHKRVYLGYQSVESSDIQNAASALVSDYKNYYTTLSYTYFHTQSDTDFFSEKINVHFLSGIGSRSTPTTKAKQYFIHSKSKYDWALNSKHHLVLHNELHFLHSNKYLTNELERFGGINSVVGFTENSLQANFYTTSRLEYRLQLSSSLYWNTLFDYSVFQDKTIASKNNSISGVGTGIKLATKKGLMSLVYAYGSASNQTFTYKNSLVHLSIKSYF